MKKLLKAGILCLTAAMLLIGCSGKEGEEKAGGAELPEIQYPISIDGTDIIVGETKMQALLEKGLKITVSEKTADNQIERIEIDSEMEMEPNSYYSGGNIWVTDSVFALISLVTDENAVKMGDAVIGRLEFSLNFAEEEELDKISLNGIPVSQISREKAGEMFPGSTGDDFILLYGTDYEYTLSFSQEDGMLSSFSVAKEYDVDWSSKK